MAGVLRGGRNLAVVEDDLNVGNGFKPFPTKADVGKDAGKNMHERKLTRLKGYDYAQDGYYFVTVCAHDKQEWFGKIEDGVMILNVYGNIALICWNGLPNHYGNIKLDEFVIMPTTCMELL